MRRIPQYVNPRIQLRVPPLEPITIEEYRRLRGEYLGYIGRLMAGLMLCTGNRPKLESTHASTRIALSGTRDMIAQRQQGLVHLRKRLAAVS